MQQETLSDKGICYLDIKNTLLERGDELSINAAQAIGEMYQNNLKIVSENNRLREQSGYNEGYLLGFQLGKQLP